MKFDDKNFKWIFNMLSSRYLAEHEGLWILMDYCACGHQELRFENFQRFEAMQRNKIRTCRFIIEIK